MKIAPVESAEAMEHDLPIGISSAEITKEKMRRKKSSHRYSLRRMKHAVTEIFHRGSTVDDLVDATTNELVKPPWYIILPTSPLRIYWENFLSLCLVEVVFYQTFNFVFGAPDGLFLLNEIINVLFVLDWISNFFEAMVGEEGTTETKLDVIVKDYLSSSRAYVNLITAIPYELIQYAVHQERFAIRKTASFFNVVVNVGKVLRLYQHKGYKRHEALTTFDVWMNRSPTALALVRVAHVVLYFVFVAHFWSCIMVILFDDSTTDPRESWMAQANSMDSTPTEQYFTALYYSITTLTTIGYGDIAPVGFWERNLWIVMGISGAIMYAGIFGTVTAQVQKIDSMRAGLTEELQTIGTFCKLYDIPLESEMKLLSYRRHQWDATKGLQIEKVLSDLPLELVTEIKVCLYKEDILKISYFTDVGDNFIRAIVPFIKPSVCMSGDFIVRQGDPATELYCLKFGIANVQISVEGDITDDGFIDLEEVEVINTIKTGEMFGNIGLLLKQNHRMASVQARSFCELWSISRDAFDFVMPDFPAVQKRIVAHALHCLDRDMKHPKVSRESRALIKRNIKELEMKMKGISEKLVRRRMSCLAAQQAASKRASHLGRDVGRLARKSSRGSLTGMLSVFGGLGGGGSAGDSDKNAGKSLPTRERSGVDIVREMRRRADRRASEQSDLEKAARAAGTGGADSSSKSKKKRGTRFVKARQKRVTTQMIDALNSNTAHRPAGLMSPTAKKTSPSSKSERRRSLVSPVGLFGGSLEARQNRKGSVGFTGGPPGLQQEMFETYDAKKRHNELVGRIDSIEEKLDVLLSALGSAGSADHEEKQDDVASSDSGEEGRG